MGFRIGIVGAQGVGKTTLAQALSSLLNCPLIEEQIRKSVDKFNVLGYRTPDQLVISKWYPHLMFDILINQVQMEHFAKDGFVSDRTTLDYYAYYDLLSNEPQIIRDIIEGLFLPRVKNSYDIIFYLPIAFPLVGDNYRNEDINFQRKVDRKIQKLLTQYTKVTTLHTYTLNDRLQEAITVIKAYECNINTLID